jgi:hypothetical protein
VVLPYSIIPCDRIDIREFIEKNHYSHSINGVRSSYCFKLLSQDGSTIGAALFGGLAMANNWKRFGDKESDVIELRRLVCINETMKNTESYFISRCLRWLKQNTDIKVVVSYADENYNHSGTIYKASNFTYLGKTKPSKMILLKGKLYHDKTIRTTYNGKLKPFAIRIKEALSNGEASFVDTKFKHVYIYNFERFIDSNKGVT